MVSRIFHITSKGEVKEIDFGRWKKLVRNRSPERGCIFVTITDTLVNVSKGRHSITLPKKSLDELYRKFEDSD